MNEGDTIFALASGQGRAGVAVVRVSGGRAGPALEALTGGSVPPARRAVLRAIHAPETGARLDQALVLWFPAPASFTGEDCAELHLHGGRAVIESVLGALGRQPGCRMAEAGEFTRRALYNDRMDLVQVEALADLIAADTEGQQRQALGQLDGQLSRLYEDWAARLLRAAAHFEAAIDFADEEIPADLDDTVRRDVETLATEMRRHLADKRRGERLREGISIAILGEPNVGKSSLLNLLARRDVAIVSDVAGTTRDVLDVHLDLSGYPVTIADTAGIRAEAEAIEAEGIRRALARAEAADITLLLADARNWPNVPRETAALKSDKSILVANKADMLERQGYAKAPDVQFVSAKSGAGVDALLARLTEQVRTEFEKGAGEVPLTRARHREAVTHALAALDRFLATPDLPVDLAAEELRVAVQALGRITGRVDVEDFLDVIFRDFCIGK